MRISLPHKFTATEAKSRVINMINEAKTQAAKDVTIQEERWEGNTLHFAVTAQGQKLAGTFEVKDSEFILDVKLPFYLRPFEGKIQKMILEQAQAALKQGGIGK